MGLIISSAVGAGSEYGNDNGTWYCGFSLRETAGSTAVVRIRDGSSSGTILDTIPFAANEGVSDYYGAAPIYCHGKIHVQLVSGTIPEGSIRWR